MTLILVHSQTFPTSDSVHRCQTPFTYSQTLSNNFQETLETCIRFPAVPGGKILVFPGYPGPLLDALNLKQPSSITNDSNLQMRSRGSSIVCSVNSSNARAALTASCVCNHTQRRGDDSGMLIYNCCQQRHVNLQLLSAVAC